MNTPLNTPNGTTFNCIIFIVLTNRHGHPHEETLERIEKSGTKVFRTDKSGAIIIQWRNEKTRVWEYK